MRKSFGLLIAGISLIVLGIVICIVSVTAMGFRFDNLDTQNFVTTEFDALEEFRDIKVHLVNENLVIKPSDGEECRVVFYDAEDARCTCTVTDGELSLESHASRETGFGAVVIQMHSPQVTIYLPKGEYGKLTMESTAGEVEFLEGFSFETVNIHLSAGDAELEGVTALKKISVETNLGDIELDKCDAPEIFLKTNNGDISGTLLTGKKFDVHASVGSIEVPKDDASGGTCEIHTNFGDVEIEIK